MEYTEVEWKALKIIKALLKAYKEERLLFRLNVMSHEFWSANCSVLRQSNKQSFAMRLAFRR
jgi:hypothetical protein